MLRAGIFGLLGLICAASSATALVEQRERWTLSTKAGVATLALVAEPGASPAIMFVCGASLPGIAQVIIANPDARLNNRRLRIDIEAGRASAMMSAQWATDVMSASSAALGEISVDKMHELLRANTGVIGWRVDVTSSFSTPLTMAPMPHPLGRHRNAFMRFCA